MTKGKDHKSHYRVAIVLAALSLLSAFIFNEINLKHLQKDHVPLRENETIITADDYTYISPAQNLLTTGEFKENFPGNGAFLIRSPGYSSIYAFFGLFLDFKNTLFAVKILQLVLFALAIYCMYFIALYFLLNQTWALIVTGFYGFSGIGFGFIYYTLTEGITPALIIIFTFILLQAKKLSQ
ncbi:hypothetical protein CW751_08335 [Brumimicrobium salinarum]|uniref:Glycosyltransferase RgtA/B/C/D-like domain-containing protein n=1 Tax=Brumimicrobium salinarum TaxID=2058658 RepID=A0A2I0R2I2_9FLAO|nr:hypothetical protein [Brumimicrobium salinarum]PKR80769.1 hypothetical protein CW751_08335 [Brumimicrobium salinarum]